MAIFNQQSMDTLKKLRELDLKRSRESFLHYYQRMTGFTPQPHHTKICQLIQAMDNDKIDRAMVSLPPRMAPPSLWRQACPSPQ